MKPFLHELTREELARTVARHTPQYHYVDTDKAARDMAEHLAARQATVARAMQEAIERDIEESMPAPSAPVFPGQLPSDCPRCKRSLTTMGLLAEVPPTWEPMPGGQTTMCPWCTRRINWCTDQSYGRVEASAECNCKLGPISPHVGYYGPGCRGTRQGWERTA